MINSIGVTIRFGKRVLFGKSLKQREKQACLEKKRLFISNKPKLLQKDQIVLSASSYITCYSRVWIEQIQKVQRFLVQVALNLTTNKSFKYQDAN